LKVDAKKSGAALAVAIDLPEGTTARVSMPVSSGGRVTVNGAAANGTAAENGARTIVTLDHAGHFELAGS
jgi:hypothetical protein